jgi:hypothetical protein
MHPLMFDVDIMPNPRLTEDQIKTIFRPLFDDLIKRVSEIAGDDQGKRMK